MSFTRPFLLGPVFFGTALPCSGGYHLERVGMTLHDVAWDKLQKTETITEYQGADDMYRDEGCMLMIVCVLSDLT